MMANMIVGGLFNAVAFAGAGFLFSKLNHRGYEKEIKRHNKAIEDLASAKGKWYERQVEKKNRIAILRQQLNNANKDLNETNKALHALREAHDELIEDEEPTLSDYYEPSNEMKQYQNVTIAVVGLGSGYMLMKLI